MTWPLGWRKCGSPVPTSAKSVLDPSPPLAAQEVSPVSLKSFFESVGEEFKKLFGKVPTLSQTIRSVVSYVAPLVETGIALADPALEPVVADVVSTVQADLATVSATAGQVNVAPGTAAATTISTALSAINSNLSGLLEVAEVKNSAEITKIKAAVTAITGEIGAVLASLTGTAAPAPAATS